MNPAKINRCKIRRVFACDVQWESFVPQRNKLLWAELSCSGLFTNTLMEMMERQKGRWREREDENITHENTLLQSKHTKPLRSYRWCCFFVFDFHFPFYLKLK